MAIIIPDERDEGADVNVHANARKKGGDPKGAILDFTRDSRRNVSKRLNQVNMDEAPEPFEAKVTY